ncbi:AlbA family DNA-binding domain-containing protein [Nostoc sp.]|uniref:AlbA family DNA-binding domain-containing protein n=1 Tax=Nostoc sp. TaxID=1180 RepID=UPI002FF4BC98
MITLETLEKWLLVPTEAERLEFKEAKQQFDLTKLLKYCVALVNEGGGYIVLGVTDKRPRQVVGSPTPQRAIAYNIFIYLCLQIMSSVFQTN